MALSRPKQRSLSHGLAAMREPDDQGDGGKKKVYAVLDRFAETFGNVAAARSDLAPQCESLISDLHKLTVSPPPELSGNSLEDDVPLLRE